MNISFIVPRDHLIFFYSLKVISNTFIRDIEYFDAHKKIEITLQNYFDEYSTGLCRAVQSFAYRNRHWQPAIHVRVVKCLQKLLLEIGSFYLVWVCVCVRWRAAYTTTESKIVFEKFLYSIDGVIAMP